MADEKGDKKPRKPRIKNFTTAEDNSFIPYMVEHHELFFGALSQGGATAKRRQQHQEHVVALVNS